VTGAIEMYESGNAFNRNIYLIFIGIGIAILVKRGVDFGHFAQKNQALLFFSLYGALSIAWSDYPLVAMKGYVKAIIANVTMVLIVLTDPAPVEAVKRLIRRSAYVLIPLSVVFSKYFPDIGRVYHSRSGVGQFTGVTRDGNSLSTTCYICGLIIIWDLIQKDASKDKVGFGMNLMLLGMILWLFRMADGGTAIVCTMIAAVLLILIRKNVMESKILAIARHMGILLVIVTPILIIGFAFFLNTISSIFGHSETLWGRYELWGHLLSISGNPLIGTGFQSFWSGSRVQTMWEIYWWRPTEAHSGYVETYLTLGYFGLFLLGAVIVGACKRASGTTLNSDLRALRIAYLFSILLYNLLEAGFRTLHPTWFLFLLMLIETRQLVQEEEVTEPQRMVGRFVAHAGVRAIK